MKSELSSLKGRYMAEHSQLALAYSMDAAAFRAGWKTRSQERREAFESCRKLGADSDVAHYAGLLQDDSGSKPEKGRSNKSLDHYRELMEGLNKNLHNDSGRSNDRER